MAMVRLQKVLSERGIASRRKAEELIAEGHVKVNGRDAKASSDVKSGDIIEITHAGDIQETYPAQINGTYGIEVIE